MKGLTTAVLGICLTTVLATTPNLYPATMKDPKDTKPKVQTGRDSSQVQRRLEREVRHELVTLLTTMFLTTLSIEWTVAL
jgi:hypothetical protein